VSRGGKRGTSSPEDKQGAKAQREAARTARSEDAARRRRQASLKKTLTKAAWAAVGVAAVVAFGVYLSRTARYTAGSDGAIIEGVQRYQNGAGHVTGGVAYPQTPPTGGEHNPSWLNCGIYTEAVPNELGVHSLEHGAVWVTYDPSLSQEQLATLRTHLPSSYVVMSPFTGLPSPIVLSAWNVQLRVASPDDPRIRPFFEEYWRSQFVPEPGALCTGGIDGPGRVS